VCASLAAAGREEDVAGEAAAGMKAIQFTEKFASGKEPKRLGVVYSSFSRALSQWRNGGLSRRVAWP